MISVISVTFVPKEAKSSGQHTENPTVFVHGYKGTHNSFGHMLDRFENKYNWGNKALVYHVSPHGTLNAYNLNKGKTEPTYVQVIFENNRADFADTTRWLAKVLAHMKREYQVDSVNLVGHSMGGLVSLKFIEEYLGQTKYPTVDKLITIGSPFDGIYNDNYFRINRDPATIDLKPKSGALQIMRVKKHAIPDDLKVLSIGSTGDFVAVPESVKAIRNIIEKDQLTEVMIQNEKLGHSELHESVRVDKLIHSFLVADNMSNSVNNNN